MEAVDEDLSARVLLKNVLHAEAPKSPVTRSKSQVLSQALPGVRQSPRIRRSAAGLVSPQVAVRQKMKQRLHEKATVSPVQQNKRSRLRTVDHHNNMSAAGSPLLLNDDITPRHLLRRYLQTGPEMSILVPDRPAKEITQSGSTESSLCSNRPSTGMSDLDIPDLSTVNLTMAVRGISRKRPQRKINLSTFERNLDLGDEHMNDEKHDLSNLSAGSDSCSNLSLKTPYVDLCTEKHGMRRAVKRRAISVEDFEEGVHKRLTLKRNPDLEQGVAAAAVMLSETGVLEKLTLELSDATASESTNIMSSTTLYTPPTPRVPQAATPIQEEEDGSTAAQGDAKGGLEPVGREDVSMEGEEEGREGGVSEEEEGMHASTREASGGDVKEGTGKGDVEEGTGKGGVEDGTGKGGVEEGTGKGGVEEGTGKGGVEEGTGKGGVEEGTGKGDVEEGTGKGDEEEPEAGCTGSEVDSEERWQEEAQGVAMDEGTAEADGEGQEEDVASDREPVKLGEKDSRVSASEWESSDEERVVSHGEVAVDSAESGRAEDDNLHPDGSVEHEGQERGAEVSAAGHVTHQRAYRSEGGALILQRAAGTRGYRSLNTSMGLYNTEWGETPVLLEPSGEGEARGWESGSRSRDMEQSPPLGSPYLQTRSPWPDGPQSRSSPRVQERSGASRAMECQQSPLGAGALSPVCSPQGDEGLSVGLQPEPAEPGGSLTAHEEPHSEPVAAGAKEGDEEEAESEGDDELSMNTPAFVRQKRITQTPGPLNTPSFLKAVMNARRPTQANGTKPRRRQPAPATNKDPGLPKSYLMSVFKHFAKTSVSQDVYPVLKDIMEMYFDRMADDLETYARHAKRKTIEVEDVELLLRRQGFVTDSMPLNVLIEKYLPYEYRKQLIPVATSGNKVVPKQRR